jgi:hypothetical protein
VCIGYANAIERAYQAIWNRRVPNVRPSRVFDLVARSHCEAIITLE